MDENGADKLGGDQIKLVIDEKEWMHSPCQYVRSHEKRRRYNHQKCKNTPTKCLAVEKIVGELSGAAQKLANSYIKKASNEASKTTNAI